MGKWIGLCQVLMLLGTAGVFFGGEIDSNQLKVQFNLSGPVQDVDKKELAVIFSDDMIALGDHPDGAGYLKIEPACAGDYEWRGTKTLVFKPKERFRYATRYVVTVPAGIRSLNGKTASTKIQWDFSTPEVRLMKSRGFNSLSFQSYQKQNAILYTISARDSFSLYFNQPVSAEKVKKFCSIVSVKKKHGIPFKVNQSGNAVTVAFPNPLPIGKDYRILLKKGLTGNEGPLPLTQDILFYLASAARFRLMTGPEQIVHCDMPRVILWFSYDLQKKENEELKKHFQLFRLKDVHRSPVSFRVACNQALVEFSIDEPMAPGDLFLVHISPDLADADNDTLGATPDILVRICSPGKPRVEVDWSGKMPRVSGMGLKQADVAFFHFSDDLKDILPEVTREQARWRDYARPDGLLANVIMPKGLVQRESMLTIRCKDANEWVSQSVDLESMFGCEDGFFGFLVKRGLAFNFCNETSLFHFPLTNPFELQVVYRHTIDFIARHGPGKTIFWVYDNQSGAAEPGSILALRRGDQTLPIGTVGQDGQVTYTGKFKQGDRVSVRRPDPPGIAYADIKGYQADADTDEPNTRAVLFTERGFYLPGEEVHVSGVVKGFRTGRLLPPHLSQVWLLVKDPDYDEVETRKLDLDNWGGFSTTIKTQAGWKKGLYQFGLFRDEEGDDEINGGMCYLTIDYYQPDTFTLDLEKSRSFYFKNETFSTKVSGAFLYGNPMAEEKVKILAGAVHYWNIQKLLWKSDLSGYSFNLDEKFRKENPEYKQEIQLDKKGKAEIAVPLNFFPHLNCISMLWLQATGISAEGKEVNQSTSSIVLPGKRLCGIKTPWYAEAKNDVKINLALLDEKGNPASGMVTVTLFREIYNRNSEKREIHAAGKPVEVAIDGKKEYALQVQEPGYYLVKVDAKDSAGGTCSSSSRFCAWSYAWSRMRNDLSLDGIKLESEKNDCRIGDKVVCYLRSPLPGKALVTVESSRILETRLLEVSGTTPIEVQVTRDHFPCFQVHVEAVLQGGMKHHEEIGFVVLDETNKLKVEVELSRKTAKPAEKQRAKIRVSDSGNRRKKARVFVYGVDEGVLALSRYEAPQLHRGLYYIFNLDECGTIYSQEPYFWTFPRPLLDITPRKGIWGRIVYADGTPAAGATITLKRKGLYKKMKTIATANGYYLFPDIAEAEYTLAVVHENRIRANFKVKYHGGIEEFNEVLVASDIEREKKLAAEIRRRYGIDPDAIEPEGNIEEYVNVVARAALVDVKSTVKGVTITRGIGDEEAKRPEVRLRQDFNQVLFFRHVETDEKGEAKIEFSTNDQLSTFRIMAVAYTEEDYGTGEAKLLVTKDVLLAEAMPEFARSDDSFTAGVQVGNRTPARLDVTVFADAVRLSVVDEKQKKIEVAPHANKLVPFDFHAGKPAEAEVRFYADSKIDKDGLLKKLPVTDNLVTESQLDFDSGPDLKKRIHPPGQGEQTLLKLDVAPSVIRPAVKIAEKLFFYPYECLEQRTSKVLPYLVLSDEIVSRMEIKLDADQVKKTIENFINAVPEFMYRNGGLSYYRGSDWASPYLTAYVYWALIMAQQKGFTVEAGMMSKIEEYLQEEDLSDCSSAFFQFTLSLGKKAEEKNLQQMFEGRVRLSIPARVFLYRALGYQMKDRERQKIMAREFKNSLQVESDFAYFDVREFTYDRDLPFYCNRYATAMILQALLEWEEDFDLAPRVMRWLLEVPVYEWDTTQTNFWILYAVREYIRREEPYIGRQARLDMLGTSQEKRFAGPRDVWKLERDITKEKSDFDVAVKAEPTAYLCTELCQKLRNPQAKSRGITVRRNIYSEDGKPASAFKKGADYQVELLIDLEKEVPYAVIDEPLAAGFELIRWDTATGRDVREFNRQNAEAYGWTWAREEHATDRTVFYTYSLWGNRGKIRIVYFIKAIYSGEFTWLPAVVQGMYHPQFFARCATQKVAVTE